MAGKVTRKVKIIATIMLIAMGLQCFPIPVLGSNFSAQLAKRDQFIKKANTKVNQSLNKQLDLITKVTKGGFSFLEKQTGLNEQNKLYKTTKNRTLEKTGFKLGVAEGTKDFSMGAFSFLATPDKLPTKVKAMGGAVKNAVSSTVSNPRAVASGLSSSFYGWLTHKEADPLKRGRRAGKTVGFEGAFFVAGGTTVKAANKASKVAGIVTKTPKARAVAPKAASITPKAVVAAPKAASITSKTATVAASITSKAASITSKIAAPGVKINSKAKILTEKAWHSVTRGFNNIKVGGTSKQRGSTIKNEGYPFTRQKKLPYTYNVGDLFEGVEITAKKGNVLTLANKDKLYENIKINPGEDIFAPVKQVKLNYKKLNPLYGVFYDESGKRANGSFLLVINHKKNLLMTKKKDFTYHSQLAEGKPVTWAGQALFTNGQISLIDNISGHFLPEAERFKEVFPVLQKHLPSLTKDLYKPAAPIRFVKWELTRPLKKSLR